MVTRGKCWRGWDELGDWDLHIYTIDTYISYIYIYTHIYTMYKTHN